MATRKQSSEITRYHCTGLRTHEPQSLTLPIHPPNRHPDTSQLIAKLPPHHSLPPHTISPHPTHHLLISTSPSEAIVWNTDRWTRARVLTGADDGPGGVVWAGYAPVPVPGREASGE